MATSLRRARPDSPLLSAATAESTLPRMASAAVEVENGGVRGVRFPVQSVTSGLLRYSATSDSEVRGAWSRFGAVEAVSSVPPGGGRVLAKHNMLAQAVHTAFYEHLPLRLSPDAIWITIAQGLALHINQDPEHHRSTFVSPRGQGEDRGRGPRRLQGPRGQ